MFDSAGEMMRTGNNGRIAVYWTQTELDGLEAAPLADVFVGSTWSWRGPFLECATAGQLGIECAGSDINALIGSPQTAAPSVDLATSVFATIELSNGAQSFVADIVRIKGEDRAVLIFEDGCPEREQEFWINSISRAAKSAGDAQYDANVVAFPTRAAPFEADSVRIRQVAGVAAE